MSKKEPKTLIVCDYDNPKNYTFPSFGLGSSEKRIWHFAKTASGMDGFRVIITGPNWLPEYVPKAQYFPKRLSMDTADEFLEQYGKCDYLFAGMEYFDKEEWTIPFRKCARIRLSYQLHPYNYKKIAFDGKDDVLFCYSDEMCKTYKEQKPIKQLLFHSGVDEEPFFSEESDDYLLWIGRFDEQKAPHLAIMASELLGMKFGREKMEIIIKARCALYTLDRGYHEAGAGVLGEILSSGVPIAGISWAGDDAVCEAVDNDALGAVSVIKRRETDQVAVRELAESVKKCLKINRRETYRLGSYKYDPRRLVAELFEKIEK